MSPTVRAGSPIRPVVPSSAPGAPHASTSRAVSSPNRPRQSPVTNSGSWLKSTSSRAASAWKFTTTRNRWFSSARTSYSAHGVGSPSRASSMPRTTGIAQSAAASSSSLIFCVMPPPCAAHTPPSRRNTTDGPSHVPAPPAGRALGSRS